MTYIMAITVMNRAGRLYDIIREAHALPLATETLNNMLTAFECDAVKDMSEGDIMRASVVTDRAGRVYCEHHE